jgi:hypothetical protein
LPGSDLIGALGRDDPAETSRATRHTVRPSTSRITGAGLVESHVHEVTITREAPNYRTR